MVLDYNEILNVCAVVQISSYLRSRYVHGAVKTKSNLNLINAALFCLVTIVWTYERNYILLYGQLVFCVHSSYDWMTGSIENKSYRRSKLRRTFDETEFQIFVDFYWCAVMFFKKHHRLANSTYTSGECHRDFFIFLTDYFRKISKDPNAFSTYALTNTSCTFQDIFWKFWRLPFKNSSFNLRFVLYLVRR